MVPGPLWASAMAAAWSWQLFQCRGLNAVEENPQSCHDNKLLVEAYLSPAMLFMVVYCARPEDWIPRFV